MSVVEVRQVKKNIKKHKNAIDGSNYSHNDSMQWGLSHQAVPKALCVGSTHPKSELKRIKKAQKLAQLASEQQKQMFDIHEAAKKAIQANKVAE